MTKSKNNLFSALNKEELKKQLPSVLVILPIAGHFQIENTQTKTLMSELTSTLILILSS